MVQENCVKDKIIIICGPTASQKSLLAVRVAKMLDSEVISADSLNVYRRLNIGTAKPTIEEMSGVKHHLIDVVEPTSDFSVGNYRELALPIIKDLHKKGKIPVVCGGTGFYINSILYNLSYGESCANLQAREKYKELAQKYGNSYVFNILYKVDSKSAKQIHCNDIKKVIRALEIFESGKKKSDIQDTLVSNFDYYAYSMDFEREELYSRIDKRVDKMIEKGLIEEVKALLNSGIDKNFQCMQGIGYKEVVEYLEGKYSLNECINTIKLNTRHYAKRQITFFKKLEGLVYLKPSDIDSLAKRIVNDL